MLQAMFKTFIFRADLSILLEARSLCRSWKSKFWPWPMGTSRRSQLLNVESTLFCLQRCNIKVHVQVCQNTTLILCYTYTHNICTSIEDMGNCQALSFIWNICRIEKAVKKVLNCLFRALLKALNLIFAKFFIYLFIYLPRPTVCHTYPSTF